MQCKFCARKFWTVCVCFFTNDEAICFILYSDNHRSWSGRAGIAGFLLLYDLLPLHLSTFSQGGAFDTDSENVSVGAITLSSVVVCWEGKDFQWQTRGLLYEDRPVQTAATFPHFFTAIRLFSFHRSLTHIQVSCLTFAYVPLLSTFLISNYFFKYSSLR